MVCTFPYEVSFTSLIYPKAIGPLFLGPMSEIFGRLRLIQSANLFFLRMSYFPFCLLSLKSHYLLVWNIACGLARNEGELIAFRFLSGLGGSAPLSVGGAVLGDCWRNEERGKAIALYSLAPLLGAVFVPIAGAWITERTTWRWVVCISHFEELISMASYQDNFCSSGRHLSQTASSK